MPNKGTWLTNAPVIARTASRAVAAWKRINDRPTSVVFNRGGVDQSAQTVRVEEDSGGAEVSGPVVTSGTQGVVVYGVKNHPTVADTVIVRGDRFWIESKEYEITDVILTFGEIQAFGEAQS